MPDHATAFAPGRINLIGEHTDYNQGLALAFALTDGVTVDARALAAPRIEAAALDLGETERFSLPAARDGAAPRVAQRGAEQLATDESGWRAFVRGALAELQRAGVPLRGAELEISGTLARGSGLASSAALEVALCLALIELAGVDAPDRVELAQLCARIENAWVGARTGLLDQLTSLFGAARSAVLIDFRTLSVTPFALETGDHRLITADSGQSHVNAASAYNRRRAECEQACAELDVATLRDVTPAMAARLPEPLARRARHVISENARVLATVEALAHGDFDAVAGLLNASHTSLRDDYEVSTPAVEATVTRLRAAGASGARIMGGGFGGHVLALLPPAVATPAGARVVTPAGPGAAVLDPEAGTGAG